jgi:adenylate cyclase
MQLGQSEMGLGHYDAAIDEERRSIEIGYRNFISYVNLAAAYGLAGKEAEAKSAIAEARRLNPKLTVKWWMDHGPSIPIVFEGGRKAGLPEE